MPPREIKVSTDQLAAADDSPVATVGTAPVKVSATDPPGGEPDEYPVDFDEWQAGKPAYFRTHIAGYRHEVRLAGGLTKLKMRNVWEHGFKVFLGEAQADDAPKD